MKVIWLDTETTGLDPVRHDIWQLAYILVDGGKEVYRNLLECRPWAPWNADPKALEVGITKDGRKISEVATQNYTGFMHPMHAAERFTYDLSRLIDKYNKHDKAAIGGWNVTFDLNMLSWWYKKYDNKYGLGSYTDYTILDGASMARQMRHLGYLPLENTKLVTVCAYYDITIDIAHNAMSDTDAAMRVYPCVLNDYRDMLNQEQYFGQFTEGEFE